LPFLSCRGDNASLFDSNAWAQLIRDQKVDQPFSMGAFALLSLLIANGLYQIVDIGQWQRLASVRFSVEAIDSSRAVIARAIRVTMVYSAGTWIVAIALGMALRYVDGTVAANPWDALSVFLLQCQATGDVLHQAIVVLLIISLVA
jgi:hypothetical protein